MVEVRLGGVLQSHWVSPNRQRGLRNVPPLCLGYFALTRQRRSESPRETVLQGQAAFSPLVIEIVPPPVAVRIPRRTWPFQRFRSDTWDTS
jgi:hypothetical protein